MPDEDDEVKVSEKSRVSIPIAMVATVVIAIGSVVFNLYNSLGKSETANLVQRIETIEQTHENFAGQYETDKSVLHQRISGVAEEVEDVEDELDDTRRDVAVYMATISQIQSDIGEIKSDMKELGRRDTNIGDAIRNALNEWANRNPPE